ncbi:Ppx/GppA family phosphatase [Sneathiella litorea]|uniref:Ppx/GppA family phosphatase n=1 Tax=Sneathiella litorea TaxID=2606216 RepID=A0A6L8W5I2_9PROT|nr:Ppx/GppA family phosphatase [Sneathiella litorea]MZR30341.1 Ppx/GppA family phosphatase [Sneathiella litorea]
MEERDRDLDPAVKLSDRSTAVIDIGSNSVRLVVFDGPQRVPLPKFNEKVLCGLGKELGTTGRLGDKAMADALSALRRYAALVHHMGIERVMVAATAAVREAENGSEFVSAIEQECDLNVQVLSGRQEARYSGLGVLSGMPHANGLAGDLGGGSLELVEISDFRINETATLPLGALRLSYMDMPEKKLRKFINKKFGKADWLQDLSGRDFYAVGGAWRVLARYHIFKNNHPLNIIHNYRLTLAEMTELIDEILGMSIQELYDANGIPKSRANTMHTAAIIMQELLTITAPNNIFFSGNGLREGMLFSELKKSVRRRDPLLDACRDMAAAEGRFAEHGEEIFAWLLDLLSDVDEKGRRLTLAAATLSDIAWWANSDYRAAQAFRRIFRAPFNGIGHRGRAMVALSVYARYKGDFSGPATDDSLRLLTDEEAKDALTIGLALRLSHTLSGGTVGILSMTQLETNSTTITLKIPKSLSVLVGHHVVNQFEALGANLEVEPVIEFIPD